MQLYRVKDWGRHFEVSQGKKVKKASWVPFPVKHDGKTFRRLMAMDDGLRIFGAWVLIVQIAAKCEMRGSLVDDEGPLGPEDLAIKTGCDVSDFERALEVLTGDRFGWIVVEPYERARSALPLEERRGEEIRGEERRRESRSAVADRLSLQPWLDWWNRLHSEGLVPAGVDATCPSRAVIDAWTRIQKSRELRELISNRDAVEREIRACPFCREGWFRLEKLFGGKNREREYVLRKLLDGGYRPVRSEPVTPSQRTSQAVRDFVEGGG